MSGLLKPNIDNEHGDDRIKRALEVLKRENIRLKKLVVTLSESMIRNVTGKR